MDICSATVPPPTGGLAAPSQPGWYWAHDAIAGSHRWALGWQPVRVRFADARRIVDGDPELDDDSSILWGARLLEPSPVRPDLPGLRPRGARPDAPTLAELLDVLEPLTPPPTAPGWYWVHARNPDTHEWQDGWAAVRLDYNSAGDLIVYRSPTGVFCARDAGSPSLLWHARLEEPARPPAPDNGPPEPLIWQACDGSYNWRPRRRSEDTSWA